MSSPDASISPPVAEFDSDSESTARDMAVQLELLEEENRRLRNEYARQRRTEHRRAALALGGVGAVAVAGAALFPAVRSVLLVVGAIGFFGGVLTRYLTPERFVSAEIGERVYAALAGNEAAFTAELGLQDDRVYVPVDGPEPARLFIPQRREWELPADDDLSSTLVVPESDAARGLALTPTGAPLYREFERGSTVAPADTASALVEALAESFVETFEIVAAVDTDVDVAAGRATVDVTGGVFGDGTDFDDPVTSTLAVGLAAGLGSPIRAETATTDDGYTVSCSWGTEVAPSSTARDTSPDGATETARNGP